jgi:hypothetical protein
MLMSIKWSAMVGSQKIQWIASRPMPYRVRAFIRRTKMPRVEYDESDVDEHGVVRDGGRVKVRMTAMDHLIHDALDRSSRVIDASLHRPGFRTDSQAYRDGRAARARAFQLYDAEAENSWRNPPTGFGSGEVRVQRAGDLCTIDGHAGHLRHVNGVLTCVPDSNADTFPHRKQIRDPFNREAGVEEFGRDTCEGCGGTGRRPGCNSGICPVCHGSGVDPGDNEDDHWLGERDDHRLGVERDHDEETDAARIAREEVSTHTESTGRLDALRRRHAERMAREYALIDAELTEAWKKP